MINLKIADLFTLANLAAGFSAILTQDIRLAAGLIVLGACMDVLDGLVARWMNQTSELGKQLDSLADMVTFGVAPAVLFLHLFPGEWMVLPIATVIPIFSAWRLATFNLLPSQPHFVGLPTPANAAWYVGLALWVQDPPFDGTTSACYPVLAVITILLGLLMVSPVIFPSIKSGKALRTSLPEVLAAGVGMIAAWILGWPTLALSAGMFLFIVVVCLKFLLRKG